MDKVSKVGTFLLAATIAACASAPENTSPEKIDLDDPLAGMEQSLTPLATQCTFNKTTGLMTVSIASGETAVIARSAADSAILQNGQPCDNPVTATTLKKITVTGSAGDDTLLLDFTNGLFALGTTSAASSGISVDLGAGTGDKLAIKGTTAADNFNFGAASILLNTDANRDITYANVESFVVSLGDGDDVYTSAGGGAAGAVFGQAIAVFGGPGNDTFHQGAAATVSETISGGTGTDTVSYASRSAAVTVTIGAGANDGAASENDDIMSDVEVVTGGAGDDSLTAATGVGATLNGGPGNDTLVGDSGNDTLNGGPGNDTLRGKAGNDVMNGDDGDDTFDEESAENGGDIMNGGAGIDTVDYSARTNALVVTMDGAAANDGESGEKDNVKGDIENIKGGSGDDTITGNALSNVITGGPGNDTLSGGAGDDVFPQGSAADGNDTISGGAGVDKVDYSGRSADITAALDGVTASGDLAASEADILGTDIENLEGGAGDDVLTGNASANELVGNAGDDTLHGLGGDDTIEGGAGDDVINCGSGFDVTVGRVGNDTINPDCEI
ncbi:MAG: calcium-binding protein [Labilithrix sp.]|nr:calcium-binding protein [Labilithrix sp.]